MLTPLTLTAISVLRHISSHETGNLQDLECGCKPLDELLDQLESAGLIRVRTDQSGSGIPKTYELTRPLFRISLLDLMEAVDQHLNCNQPDCEKMYARYHYAAHKLGIVNQMTRAYKSVGDTSDRFIGGLADMFQIN